MGGRDSPRTAEILAWLKASPGRRLGSENEEWSLLGEAAGVVCREEEDGLQAVDGTRQAVLAGVAFYVRCCGRWVELIDEGREEAEL